MREARYRLTFKAPGGVELDATAGGAFQTVAGALAAAWANDASGGLSLGVTLGGLPVLDAEDLGRAMERLRAVESRCPDEGKIGCASRVLQEMGLE